MVMLMKTFTEYVTIREVDDLQTPLDPITDSESNKCLNSAVEKAVTKGHKRKLISMLRELGDEEINRELEDIDKGLGDMTLPNTKGEGGPNDEVSPAAPDSNSAAAYEG